MSDYPEHDKLAAVADQTQAAGEFAEWLAGQGVQFMVWREDLTDTRPSDPECLSRRDAPEHKPDCQPPRPDDGGTYATSGVVYWRQHCTHWLNGGDCCRCGQGQVYEVTGIKDFVPERRSLAQLLADWAGIDQGKIEAEKRQMLAGLRTMNGG